MDLVVREAGVGNATVYRQFPTKDALATAYVQERADAWFERMRAAADGASDPRDKIMAVFAGTARAVTGAGYRGCPMLNTHTEFPDRDHPAHQVSVAHKQQVRDWLRDLAADAAARDPEALADQLLLVLNGALATAAVLDAGAPAARPPRPSPWCGCSSTPPAPPRRGGGLTPARRGPSGSGRTLPATGTAGRRSGPPGASGGPLLRPSPAGERRRRHRPVPGRLSPGGPCRRSRRATAGPRRAAASGGASGHPPDGASGICQG